MCSDNSVVLGSIPGFGFHSLRYHVISKIRHNTSQRILRLASVADLGEGVGVRDKLDRAIIGVCLANRGPSGPHFY